ncbi:MAG: hypothetical protein L6265_11840 [Thermoplasmatales archaeon]|nr:hypothetical protein [Thermoplasmatales archaeon]
MAMIRTIAIKNILARRKISAILLDRARGFLYILVNATIQPIRSTKPPRIKSFTNIDTTPKKIKIEKKIITRIFLPFVNPANGDL